MRITVGFLPTTSVLGTFSRIHYRRKTTMASTQAANDFLDYVNASPTRGCSLCPRDHYDNNLSSLPCCRRGQEEIGKGWVRRTQGTHLAQCFSFSTFFLFDMPAS